VNATTPKVGSGRTVPDDCLMDWQGRGGGNEEDTEEGRQPGRSVSHLGGDLNRVAGRSRVNEGVVEGLIRPGQQMQAVAMIVRRTKYANNINFKEEVMVAAKPIALSIDD